MFSMHHAPGFRQRRTDTPRPARETMIRVGRRKRA